MFNDSKLAEMSSKKEFCVGWLYNNNIKDKQAEGITQNILEFQSCLLSSSGIVQFADSDEYALCKKAYNNGFKKILVIKQGFLDKGFWTSLSKNFHKYKDSVFVGHIIDKFEKYYTFHPQCFMLDLEWWGSLGFQDFGKKHGVPWETEQPIRSEENFHDGGYTPLWIKKGNKNKTYERKLEGWNIIKSALDDGKTIQCWQEDIRNCKDYIYAEIYHEFALKKYLLFDKKYTTPNFFIHNTEFIHDDTVRALKHKDLDIKCIVTPASGINPILYAKILKLKTGDYVLVYDISDEIIKLSKELIESFDGTYDPLQTMIEKYDVTTFSGLKYAEHTKDRINFHFSKEEDRKWLTEDLPNIKFIYRTIDLFVPGRWNKIFEILNSKDNVFIHISNIFNYHITSYNYSYKQRLCIFEEFKKQLEKKIPPENYILSGVDISEIKGFDCITARKGDNDFKWNIQQL